MNGFRFEMAPGVQYTQKTHMCVNIAGALRNKGALKSFEDDEGRPMSMAEARAYLLEEQAKGHKVIPVGDCDDFDYQTGCRGHQQACTLKIEVAS